MKLLTKYVCKQMIDVELLMVFSNTWNHLTVLRQEQY